MRAHRVIPATLVAFALVLGACGGGTSTQVVETVTPQAAADKLAGEPAPILLDIRTAPEVAEVRIDGATTIDFYAPDFRDQLAALDRDASYVVYCRSGNRSSQAMDIFRELGFADVADVDGGIVAWLNAGLPVVTGN